MRDPQRRLARLEARIPGIWPVEVEEAKQRSLARLKVRMGEVCGTSEHAAVQSARTFLIGDTPEQAAADREILQRWARQHPTTLYADDGARARITARLAEMTQRLEAHR